MSVNGYVNPSDNTKGDVVYHYGSAGALEIIKCATGSYHENGSVAFAEIAKGRIVLESGSEIKHIHVDKKTNENVFDTVIIADNGAKALPEAITRDQVDVSEPKAVVTVESGSTSETVYVYPYTDAQSTKTGTTEQTATQNTSIASALGKLALDNGADAGEKAMSNNEKTEAKTELVNESRAPELAEEKKNDINALAYIPNTDTYCQTLYEAISAVTTSDKTTIILLKNSYTNGTSGFSIASGKDIVIDLNGFTISNDANNGVGQNYAMFTNNGTLTIKDSSAKKTGLITTNAINPDTTWETGVPGTGAYTINNFGTLFIKGGTIENTGGPGGGAMFAINSQSSSRDTAVYLLGGTIRDDLTKPIRAYADNDTYENKIVVDGGTVEGRGAIWIQVPDNTGKAYVDFEMKSGTLRSKDPAQGVIELGPNTGHITAGNGAKIKLIISGGLFDGNIAIFDEANSGMDAQIVGGRFTDYVYVQSGEKIISGGTFEAHDIDQWNELGCPPNNTGNQTLAAWGLNDGKNGGNYTLEQVNIKTTSFTMDELKEIGYYTEYVDSYGLYCIYEYVAYNTYGDYSVNYIKDGYSGHNNNNGTYTVIPD